MAENESKPNSQRAAIWLLIVILGVVALGVNFWYTHAKRPPVQNAIKK